MKGGRPPAHTNSSEETLQDMLCNVKRLPLEVVRAW
jgi:hypothetical protein